MARFKSAEKKLLRTIKDDRLITSLSAIREVMEDLWAADAPRIVHDYTDHGEKHCERIAGFLVRLLAANDDRPLNEREMYLLLAGVYMHDIGMQCDVTTIPAVRTTAHGFGAAFAAGFSARTASSYSADEQKEIRKNHHLLSIAWIDYASRTGETILGKAAKTIPPELVEDLMDVCKHHTKSPITECNVTFRLDPNGRKRLVAALLRFADEMDIDSTRVSIESVCSFSVEPRNALFWWLHNRTTISFVTRNVVRISSRLNRSDYDEFSDLVFDVFISEFQTKNRPVLEILRQHGIPMAIDADSRVEMYEREQPLPSEIIESLRSLRTLNEPVVELAREVRTWLRAVRYEIADFERPSHRVVAMFATLDQGAVKQRVLVWCVDGELTVEDVRTLDARLDRTTPQGWIISDVRVSEPAREFASKDPILRVFNLSEFLQQMVWGPYISSLTGLVEKDRIQDLFVDLICYKEIADDKGAVTGKDIYPSLTSHISDWLKERGKAHMSVLGQFGAGKTWFCRYYAYQQLRRYLVSPSKERMPLLITLRAFSKAMTSQQLINDAFLEQYKLPFLGSAYSIFQEMNRRGKLLLILDGFDEMARQVDYQTVVDNFWELAKLVDANSKVVLTSRTEYFRWAKESEKILAGEEFGRRTIVLEPPKFEVIYVERLSDDQIRQVIVKRLGADNGEAIASRIRAKPHLLDMARKPVLVELLLAALDEVNSEVLENPAQVYLYATNKLLLRNIDTKRTFTTTADKLYFLCELAWGMLQTGDLRVHYTAIPDRIKSYFGDRIKDQHELDTWDFDLRSQTLLHRDAAGYYEFAHKSLAEFFVAVKFAAELGCLDPTFNAAYSEANGSACTFPIDRKDVRALASTFGVMSLNRPAFRTVLELLPSVMIASSPKELWKLFRHTKDLSPELVRYVGGNLATLLRHYDSGAFANADFTGLSVAGADFRGCDLRNAKMTRCDARETHFRGTLLPQGFFKDARFDVTSVEFLFYGKGPPSAPGRSKKHLSERDGIDLRDYDHDLYKILTSKRILTGSGRGRAVGDEYVMVLQAHLSGEFDWARIKAKILAIPGVKNAAALTDERHQLETKLSPELQEEISKSVIGITD